jgi:hypothetical protein
MLTAASQEKRSPPAWSNRSNQGFLLGKWEKMRQG